MMDNSQAIHLARTLGYLSEDEVLFLRKLARSINKKRPLIVNVGAGAGTSGVALREARPDAALLTVDVSPGGPLGGLEGERNAFDLAELRYPRQVLGDSKEVGKSWDQKVDEKIDMLFIDGDHSEEGIRGDLEAWIPHMKDEGIVAVHDYRDSKWPMVKPVTDGLMKDHELIDIEDSTIAFRIKR